MKPTIRIFSDIQNTILVNGKFNEPLAFVYRQAEAAGVFINFFTSMGADEARGDSRDAFERRKELLFMIEKTGAEPLVIFMDEIAQVRSDDVIEVYKPNIKEAPTGFHKQFPEGYAVLKNQFPGETLAFVDDRQMHLDAASQSGIDGFNPQKSSTLHELAAYLSDKTGILILPEEAKPLEKFPEAKSEIIESPKKSDGFFGFLKRFKL